MAEEWQKNGIEETTTGRLMADEWQTNGRRMADATRRDSPLRHEGTKTEQTKMPVFSSSFVSLYLRGYAVSLWGRMAEQTDGRRTADRWQTVFDRSCGGWFPGRAEQGTEPTASDILEARMGRQVSSRRRKPPEQSGKADRASERRKRETEEKTTVADAVDGCTNG